MAIRKGRWWSTAPWPEQVPYPSVACEPDVLASGNEAWMQQRVGLVEVRSMPGGGAGAKDGTWEAQRVELDHGVPASGLQDSDREAAGQSCSKGGQAARGSKDSGIQYRDELCDATCSVGGPSPPGPSPSCCSDGRDGRGARGALPHPAPGDWNSGLERPRPLGQD